MKKALKQSRIKQAKRNVSDPMMNYWYWRGILDILANNVNWDKGKIR